MLAVYFYWLFIEVNHWNWMSIARLKAHPPIVTGLTTSVTSSSGVYRRFAPIDDFDVRSRSTRFFPLVSVSAKIDLNQSKRDTFCYNRSYFVKNENRWFYLRRKRYYRPKMTFGRTITVMFWLSQKMVGFPVKHKTDKFIGQIIRLYLAITGRQLGTQESSQRKEWYYCQTQGYEIRSKA
jgi:hypothetical protein